MIAKQVAMKSVTKSDFAELIKYLTDEQDKNERVGFVSVTNCQSDRTDAVILEIINTQGKNTRAESDKTFHLVVSFPVGEQPNDMILKKIETKICDGLGYGEHQRVSVMHHDTDNLHIHIAINKIHPTLYTILDPYYSHKVLGQLCEKLEQEYGLTQVNHKANKAGSENRALAMEHHAGVESLLGWIKRECLDQMQAATSWAEIHQVMDENGLELKERGNGLVITNQDGLMVKASSVARELSKGKLENKFGTFAPSSHTETEKPKRSYEARPVRSHVDTTLLFARYKTEQQGRSANRTREWKIARDHKNRGIEEAKRSAKLKRAAIKLMGSSRAEKKLLYSLTSTALRNKIKTINEQYRQDKETLFKKYQPQQWADWLRSQATEGDTEALAALRAREAAQGLKGNVVGAGGDQRMRSNVKASQDSVTKKGTIIYRVGASAIRDDGDKLKVSRGATTDGLEAALRMAMERYGNLITVNGTDDFKEKIVRTAVSSHIPVTFADASLERRRQSLLSSNNQPENKHDSTNKRGRRTGSGISGVGSAGAATSRTADSVNNGINRFGFPSKPNIGRVGKAPPPEARNGLRNLSHVPVVRFASGSEVLLPGNVPHHLEQQGTQPDNELRRSIFGTVTAGLAAADSYIAEREKTRLKVLDISNITQYNYDKGGPTVFAGTRQVDGQIVALLKRREEIMVLPIDDATARRLKRLAVGDAVTVTANGAIKRKGRSR
ncbi:MAG: relaxase/mobilization nuclease domain-containing protein [Dehalococcoidia bacterium]|nr:relaxase/mobilization nuclease domain-containing protein [Dehalococcoidia bacterium]